MTNGNGIGKTASAGVTLSTANQNILTSISGYSTGTGVFLPQKIYKSFHINF
jgi:hypothetical protein